MCSKSKLTFFIFVLFNTCTYGTYGMNIVTKNDSLNQREVEYQKKHASHANNVLKTFLGISSNVKMPRICMSCSGGGVRAEVATIGALCALEQIGLLSAITSIALVSGSAWAIIPWILHRQPPLEYSNVLKEQLKDHFWNNHEIYSNHNLTFTEIWGHLIARRLLYDLGGTQSESFTFENIRNILEDNHAYPFPIFTTLIAETGPEYEGVEITPFSVYSKYLGAWIPTEYFGCQFSEGSLKQQLPEKSLSLFMGIMASAYTISPGDAIINLTQGLTDKLKHYIAQALDDVNAFSTRFGDMSFPNFVYQISDCNLNNKKKIHLLDYGIFLNLPIFPFAQLERKPDILIVCDASIEAVDCKFTQLKKAQIFAQKHNMHFPTLDTYLNIGPNIKIFYESQQPEIPIIIYIANTTKVPTLHLTYQEDTFNLIFNSMFDSIARNQTKQAIINVINFKIAQLNNLAISKDVSMTMDECITFT